MLQIRALRFLGLFLALAASADAATLRSPQVPLSAGALASFFASQGQRIDPTTDQIDLSSFPIVNVGSPSTSVLAIQKLGGWPLALYNASSAAPPLYMILPGGPGPAWYSMTSFHSSPDRLVVNLFDLQNSFQGSTTYLAGPPDPLNLGFAVTGFAGTWYSQDERNVGGAPFILAFAGTGAQHGSLWLCFEDPSSGAADFADTVFLIQGLAPVPTQHTSWGTLKQRFR